MPRSKSTGCANCDELRAELRGYNHYPWAKTALCYEHYIKPMRKRVVIMPRLRPMEPIDNGS